MWPLRLIAHVQPAMLCMFGVVLHAHVPEIVGAACQLELTSCASPLPPPQIPKQAPPPKPEPKRIQVKTV